MAWFKNKKTGLAWEVTDKEHIARLRKDAEYEETKKPAEPKKTKEEPDGDGDQ